MARTIDKVLGCVTRADRRSRKFPQPLKTHFRTTKAYTCSTIIGAPFPTSG